MKSTLLAILLIGVVAVAFAEERLPVQIYYGALCPDSTRFFQNQFKPIFDGVRDHASFLYVPFGKAYSVANEDGTFDFHCQQGPQECVASRIQLCALHFASDDEEAQATFLGCQMHLDADRSGETCAEEANISFSAITECVDGPLSTQLLLQAEEITEVLNITWVPTVVYNWEFDQGLTDRSEYDFQNVICEQLNNTAPICQ